MSSYEPLNVGDVCEIIASDNRPELIGQHCTVVVAGAPLPLVVRMLGAEYQVELHGTLEKYFAQRACLPAQDQAAARGPAEGQLGELPLAARAHEGGAMNNHSRLLALQRQVLHHRALFKASKIEADRKIFEGWLMQSEKEYADERKRLGLPPVPKEPPRGRHHEQAAQVEPRIMSHDAFTFEGLVEYYNHRPCWYESESILKEYRAMVDNPLLSPEQRNEVAAARARWCRDVGLGALSRQIAKDALQIEWRDTVLPARILAEHAAKLLEAERAKVATLLEGIKQSQQMTKHYEDSQCARADRAEHDLGILRAKLATAERERDEARAELADTLDEYKILGEKQNAMVTAFCEADRVLTRLRAWVAKQPCENLGREDIHFSNDIYGTVAYGPLTDCGHCEPCKARAAGGGE